MYVHYSIMHPEPNYPNEWTGTLFGNVLLNGFLWSGQCIGKGLLSSFHLDDYTSSESKLHKNAQVNITKGV